MPSSATDRDVFRSTFGRSNSSENWQHSEPASVRARVPDMSEGGPAGSTRRPLTTRVVLSVLGSAVAVAALGSFCALIYPILKELQAERVRGENGTEQRLLGFWSILVLSVSAGCICCFFSWIVTYLDSYQPGMVFPTLLTLPDFRDVSGHDFRMRYGVAVLNGIMAMLTVIWSLS